MMEFELKNYPDSVELLEQALASMAKRLEGDVRKQTEMLLARARTYVARVKLEFKPPAPSSTRVSLDGSPLGERYLTPLFLSVGDHTLQCRRRVSWIRRAT